ncbi:hypothetical protein ACFQ9X_57175, partial [Catenulispora yoronensis]
VHRLRANLRMIGGGNQSTSPYGFARKTLFRKPFGCDDPYCEDGKVFTADPAQPSPHGLPALRRAAHGPGRQTPPGPGPAGQPPPGGNPAPGRRATRGPAPATGNSLVQGRDQRTRLIEIRFWDREPAPCPDCAPIRPGWSRARRPDPET